MDQKQVQSFKTMLVNGNLSLIAYYIRICDHINYKAVVYMQKSIAFTPYYGYLIEFMVKVLIEANVHVIT